VRYTDGTTTRFRLPVETWQSKAESLWQGDKPVAAVKVDPDHLLPDDDRGDNSLEAK
jgi:hypothetical protein